MYRTLSILFLSISFSFGQDYFIVNDGVKTEDYQYNVFINANIYSGGGIIKNATLIEKESLLTFRKTFFKSLFSSIIFK